MAVITVNKDIIKNSRIIDIFLKIRNTSISPKNISIAHKITEKISEYSFSIDKLNEFRYSCIFNEVPKGSIPFITPEKIKIQPSKNVKKVFIFFLILSYTL